MLAAILPAVLARPTPPAHGGGLDTASGVVERAAQQDLDLGVDRAQVVRRPLGDGRVDSGIQSEQDLLALFTGHGSSVEGSGVDDGLGALVGAEHYQEVGDHLSAALLVHGDDVVRLEALEGLVDHGHGALDDLLAGCDDGAGLLALKHRLGDLGGVGQ